jgi:uncharacterized oxidoreductase
MAATVSAERFCRGVFLGLTTSVAVRFFGHRKASSKLQGDRGMNPKAMPLKEYISETMAILKNSPEATEIVVERARPMRFAERGDYDAFFSKYNAGWAAAQQR